MIEDQKFDGAVSADEIGRKQIYELLGDQSEADKILAHISEFSPDLSKYIVEFCFGEVFQRPALTIAEKEMITLAVLTAIGGGPEDLGIHARLALGAGLTPQKVVDVVTQCIAHAGFPRVMQAIKIVRASYAEQGIELGPQEDNSQP